ncbi:hypothetical protein [Methylocystis rosea]|uniref:hypothetical protein n=1 Tax=Methylocystis rosea TaxID=173366 RepID=UPI000381CFE6|nr:hypothetical protein [Methylocystis rosea]
MPRKVDRGTGITAYKVTAYATSPEDASALSETFDKSANAWNRAVKEGGIFHATWLPVIRTCEQILSEAKDAVPIIDTPEDFAQRILQFIAATKEAINSGDADRAARLASIVGVEWATAKLKWGWEADALRGEKVVESAKAGGHKAAKWKRPKTERVLARMESLMPKMTVSGAAGQCAKEGLGAAAGNRALWYRHRREKKL